ncbi:diaminopimelate epimerase [bacterium]|nr:diaminopimelate epimerase [bacterium]NBW56366.1 diaminopimelate epimerase [bacterium]NBX72201.1 diaminopimelate epimerase [bacterium]
MQTLLKFVKMHALGNDFVIIDRLTQAFFIDHNTVKALGHRKTGIGFDQLLILEPPIDPQHDFSYQIYNSNGSQAKQCINGVRCLAHYVNDYALTQKRLLSFQTSNQTVSCEILSPIVVKTTISLENPEIKYIDSFSLLTSTCDHVLIGNEHLICWNFNKDEKNKALSELKSSGFTLDKFNISFAQQLQTSVELETFERGVGRSASCGSAALATFLAFNAKIKSTNSLRIETQFGYVTATKNYDKISLAGPVNRTFAGEFLLKYN